MYKVVRGFSTVVKKPKMELTVRTPYKALFNNFTDFKRVVTKTNEAYLSISNRMPPAVHILPPGKLSVRPETDKKDFKGEFVHTGGWLVVHADNTCQIFLMEAVEADKFERVMNDNLTPLEKEDAIAIKPLERIRAFAMRTFFKSS